MLNFLYAFDKNYNTQALVSIYSVLQNITEKINLYLILDDTNIDISIPSKIKNHEKLNRIAMKKIDVNEKLYNLKESHVSKATYYRLFISELFDDKKLKFAYLDSDIICVSNPAFLIRKQFEDMKTENKFIGFADELYRHQYSEPFNRLNMKGDKYFNAGVMLVDFLNWDKNNLTKKSLDAINELKDKVKFWDQDILNSIIDGNYLSLDSQLNYRTSFVDQNKSIKNLTFIHYSGKSKPWDIGGAIEEFSDVYQAYYKDLFEKEYHLVCRNRKNSINKLFKNLIGLYKHKNLYFYRYLFKSIFVILKKENYHSLP